MTEIMRFTGLTICFAIIVGAITHVGVSLYIDIMSASFVFGGAIGYVFLKNERNQRIKSFGRGLIFFGWLGALIGIIAITGDAFETLGSIEKLASAFSVSLLPIFYGYLGNLVCITIYSDSSSANCA